MTKPLEETTEEQLCPNCGTVMISEDGKTYCPKCASEIDWALDDEGEE